MIRLPDVSPARLAKPMPVSRYQSDAEWSGPAGLGREAMLRDLALRRGWDLVDDDLAEHRFAAWMHEEDARFDEEVAALSPAEAKGFAERNTRDFFERAKVFKASLPEGARPAINDQLAAYEQGLFTKAAAAEDRAQVSAVRENLDVSLEATVIPATRAVAALPAGDPEKFDRFIKLKAQRFERIDRNPALSPYEKQQRKAAEAKAIDTAFAEALSPEEQQDLDPGAAIETVGERIRRLATQRQGAAAGDVLDEGLVDGARFLIARDHVATPGPLYLASVASPETALRLLQADPDSPAVDVDPAAAPAQPDLFYVDGDEAKPRTAGEVIALAEEKMAGTRLVDWGQQLTGVSPEMQAAFAADGRDAAARAATEAKLAQEDAYRARIKETEAAIEAGTFGHADLAKAAGEGGWIKGDDVPRLFNLLVKRQSANLEYERALSKFTDPDYRFDSGSTEDQHDVDLLYERDPANNAAAVDGDEDASDRLRRIFVRTGIIPAAAREAVKSDVLVPSELELQRERSLTRDPDNPADDPIAHRVGQYLLNDSIPAQFVKSAWSGVSAPYDVRTGRLDPNSQEGIRRALDLAGLITLGATGAPRGALGIGPVRPPPKSLRLRVSPASEPGDWGAFPTVEVKTTRLRSSDALEGTPEYEVLNNSAQNTIYRLDNGTIFRTNEAGRVDRHEFVLSEERGRGRPPSDIKKAKSDDQDVSHVHGVASGGTSDRYNGFLQNSNFNRGVYNVLEKYLRKIKAERVNVDLIRKRDPASFDPDEIYVRYLKDGKWYGIRFNNARGGL